MEGERLKMRLTVDEMGFLRWTMVDCLRVGGSSCNQKEEDKAKMELQEGPEDLVAES